LTDGDRAGAVADEVDHEVLARLQPNELLENVTTRVALRADWAVVRRPHLRGDGFHPTPDPLTHVSEVELPQRLLHHGRVEPMVTPGHKALQHTAGDGGHRLRGHCHADEELVPTIRRVVTFYNPGNRMAVAAVQSAREATQHFGIELLERPVSSVEDIRDRLHALRAGEAGAYFFVSDSMVISQDRRIVERATALRMVTMAYELDLVTKGALAGYGLSYRELGRLAASYVARIVGGTPPKDLPVEAVSRIALAVNLKTARALGLTIPPTMLMRSDQVVD
jgi:hypothetical protein